jgi:hypothetical protein
MIALVWEAVAEGNLKEAKAAVCVVVVVDGWVLVVYALCAWGRGRVAGDRDGIIVVPTAVTPTARRSRTDDSQTRT